MTTATLARGPPMNVSCPQPDDDDDEDALMDEEDGVGGQSPEDESRMHGLMIVDEADQDMNSDDGGDYSTGDIVDYSGHANAHSYLRKSAPSSGSLSDGEADSQDNCNGSIQSFDEYHQGDEVNGKKGGSGYSSAGGKQNSMAMMAAKAGGAKNGKNFVCDICMKTFSNAANMRRHRVRHSGIKPFECRFCQKRFFRKDHMREHMNHKHNNTQMECYFCQQVFDKEKDLFQHVTRDHDVNPRELHCQYCSFSATTIGRYLWHMTTSHPRKNSHYIDGTGETLSMAPYVLDEYESPEASPKVGQTTSRELVGSSSIASRHDSVSSGYDLSGGSNKLVKREYPGGGGGRERDRRQPSSSPPQTPTLVQSTEHSTKYRNSTATSNRFYGNLDVEESYGATLAGRTKVDAVRYVSILPNKFHPPDTSSATQHLAAEDLTAYTLPEDLSSSYPDCKSAFALLQRKMNGNSAFVAAAFAAAAVADSTGRGAGSNRRKSKAPVRMTATAEELQQQQQNSTNGASSSSVVSSTNKRERDVLPNEGAARNGNEASGGRTSHFSPILEEVMSMQQQRVSQNNFPEDLSSSGSGVPLVANGRLPSSLAHRLKAPPPPLSPQNGAENAVAEVAARPAGDQECEQKCPHCLIVYPDNVLYMLHKMLHTKDHPYRCAQCLIQFPNRYEFYAHIVNHGSASSSAQ